MIRPTVRQATGPQRRWMFWIWVALTIVGAAFLMIATPFAFVAPGNGAWMGYIVPPLMFVLLMLGLGWLAWMTVARPRAPRGVDRRADVPHAARHRDG